MNGATNDIHKMKQGYNIMRRKDGGWINILKERGRAREREARREKQKLSYQLRITMQV